ncbi:MAG: histidine phosphatase family protein [bacterium]
MKVYFVRHGESETNAGGLRLGAETPLTELGLKQAVDIAGRLVNLKIDKFVSSPWLRAKQTSEIVAKKINLPIIYSDLLVELGKPSELIGLTKNDPEAQRILTEVWDHYIDPVWHYSDEEKIPEIMARADKALTYLADLDCENLLVVTHGNFLRFLVPVALFGQKFDLATMKKWHEGTAIYNASFTVMEFKPSEEDNPGKWRLITWNDHAHL